MSVSLGRARDALEAAEIELFEMVASEEMCANINQRFALKEAAVAHKGVEARATSCFTILTV